MGWCTNTALTQTSCDDAERESLDGTMDRILEHIWAAFDEAVKTVSRELINEVSKGPIAVSRSCRSAQPAFQSVSYSQD